MRDIPIPIPLLLLLLLPFPAQAGLEADWLAPGSKQLPVQLSLSQVIRIGAGNRAQVGVELQLQLYRVTDKSTIIIIKVYYY